MKRYAYIIIGFLLTSCFEDKGNYDYQDAEVISVAGLEEEYVLLSLVDTIKITPTITTSDEGAELTYFWGIYKKLAEKIDTLATTKDLEYRVTQSAGSWELVFGVKNKLTGFTQNFYADVTVTTEFTRGWYLLKDDGEYADLDQYMTEDTIVPSNSVTNIFEAKGEKMLGKGKMLNYFTQYSSFYTDSTATMAPYTKTFVVVSDKDVWLNYIGDMGKMRSLDNVTYIPMTERAPLFASYASGMSSYFINNGGKLHSHYIMYPNSGLFSAEALRNEDGDDYSISQYFLNGRYKNLFYDEVSSSFLYYNQISYMFIDAKAAATSDMPAVNTNKELLYMGISKDSGASPAIAYMKDKTDDNLRILAQITGAYKSLVIKTTMINPEEKIFNATYLTTSQDEDVVYFVSAEGDEVWSRNISSQVERLQFKAQAGETVTMLRQRKYEVTSDANFNFNYVMVGTTNNAQEYKVHFFSKTAGNFNAEPDFVMEGKGIPRDIMYISPNLGYSTYIQGY